MSFKINLRVLRAASFLLTYLTHYRMKYTLITVTFFTIHFSNAQTTIQKVNTVTFDNIDSLFVPNLYTNTNGIKHIFTLGYKVRGDGGAGHYVWNPQSSLTPDSAFVIKPKGITGNGRWELIVDNGIVNFLQIKGIPNSLTDCKPAFRKFLSSKYSKLYIPANVENDNSHNGPYYRFNDSITITRKVEIFGDGWDKTVLAFPNSGGFYYKNSSTGSHTHDFKIKGVLSGYGAKGYNSSTKHGIYNEGRNTFDHLYISSFDGDGIYNYSISPISNSNNAIIAYNTFFWNGRNGLTIKGPDANQIEVSHNDASVNKRWGFADSSFLGNIYISNHAATNGCNETGGHSVAVLNDVAYYCLKNNKNVKPPNNNYWQAVPCYGCGPKWNDAAEYFTGGGYEMGESNHQGVFVGNYIEGDEVVNRNSTNLVLGGFLSKYGQLPGAIGNRSGVITARNFQAIQEYGNTAQGIFLFSDTAYGSFVGGRDITRGNLLGWNFSSVDQGANFRLSQGQQSAGPLDFLSTSAANYNKPLFGRNAENSMSPYGELWFRYGFFVGGHNGRNRHVEYADGPSTSGYHAAGDVVENNGTDTTVIRWTCIKEGNPGTWAKIKSGN
jgi:hypothetical protein